MTKRKWNKVMSPSSTSDGFTVVEVLLVLAISSALFIGLIGGTSTNIAAQRYNDSVQDFAEFLRRTYSEVVATENDRIEEIDNLAPCTVTSTVSAYSGVKPQIAGQNSASAKDVQTGRSNCLIYGKLITFGETLNDQTDYNTIHVYDVVGSAEYSKDVVNQSDANNDASSELIKALRSVNADVLTVRKDPATGACSAVTSGNPTTYQLEWQAYLDEGNTTESRYTGSILIARSPISGSVGTVSFNRAIPVQQILYNNRNVANCYNDNVRTARFSPSSLNSYLSATGSNAPNITSNTNICVNSEDRLSPPNGFGGRRMISVLADGSNGSAVRVEKQDSGENKCN